MPFVGHDHVYDLVYASSLVWSSVHIIDRDRLQQFAGWELSVFHEVLVNEVTCCASVNHHFSRGSFQHVCCFELYWEHDAVQSFIK